MLDNFSGPQRFSFFSENSSQNGKMQVLRKSAVFRKINFLVPGIPFPAPSLKTLRNQCFLGVLGSKISGNVGETSNPAREARRKILGVVGLQNQRKTWGKQAIRRAKRAGFLLGILGIQKQQEVHSD